MKEGRKWISEAEKLEPHVIYGGETIKLLSMATWKADQEPIKSVAPGKSWKEQQYSCV